VLLASLPRTERRQIFEARLRSFRLPANRKAANSVYRFAEGMPDALCASRSAASVCPNPPGRQRKTLGPDHPNGGAALNNLAGLLRAKGDRAGAEPADSSRALYPRKQSAAFDGYARASNSGVLLDDLTLDDTKADWVAWASA
jgi:hypothetical protein